MREHHAYGSHWTGTGPTGTGYPNLPAARMSKFVARRQVQSAPGVWVESHASIGPFCSKRNGTHAPRGAVRPGLIRDEQVASKKAWQVTPRSTLFPHDSRAEAAGSRDEALLDGLSGGCRDEDTGACRDGYHQ